MLDAGLSRTLSGRYLIIAIATLINMTQTPAQPATEDLSHLSDVELLLHEDKSRAAELFRLRSTSYTEEQRQEVFDAYDRARKERFSRDQVPIETLFERINTTEDSTVRIHAFAALRRAYDDAETADRYRIRDLFRNAWAECIPTADTGDEVYRSQVARYHTYLSAMAFYFPNEAEALPLLEERCLESGIEDGVQFFLMALGEQGIETGPRTAVLMENLYLTGIDNGDLAAMSGEEVYRFLSGVHRVLARCGVRGVDIIRRLGTNTMEFGIQALGESPTAEAEALLWETLDDHGFQIQGNQVKMLRAIYKHQFQRPSDARVAQLRPVLANLLSLPDTADTAALRATIDAAALAGDTGDTYYLPYLIALENAALALQANELESVDEEGVASDTIELPDVTDTLRRTVREARHNLE